MKRKRSSIGDPATRERIDQAAQLLDMARRDLTAGREPLAHARLEELRAVLGELAAIALADPFVPA